MNYRLVQMVEGRLVVSTFSDDNLIPAMEIRGFKKTGINSNYRHRAELQRAPTFDKLCGPMWDGDAIRYEDQSANDSLSM